MRDAEDVAREVDYATQYWDPGNGASEEDLARWADLIRARDAEVRAETLAGLTYESCGTNRLGQPTRRLVGPVEVGEA